MSDELTTDDLSEFRKLSKWIVECPKEAVHKIQDLQDELETLHAAYNDMKKEKLTLENENERMNKSNYKMRGKNQKQGAKVLRLENELRRTDPDKWDKYKKEMK